MTEDRQAPVLALLVRSDPYQRRSPRNELDVALAALAMDFRLEVYFLGSSILQLLAERDPRAALLPAAYRAWASLPEMGEAVLYGEQTWLDRLAEWRAELVMPVNGLSRTQLRRHWRHCDYSMVI